MFMVVTIFEAGGFFRPEIMATGYLGKVNQVAGVERSCFVGAFKIKINMFFHAVTVTGWAYVGAGAAGETFVTPFVPGLGVEFQVENFGEIVGFDFGAEQLALVGVYLFVTLVIFLAGIFALYLGEKIKGGG